MASELEKLQEKPRDKRTPIEQCIVDATTFEEAEHDGEIEIMEQAAKDLVEIIKNSDVIMCAYCGHESPKSDKMAVIEHTMNCEKRPEVHLLKKAFEIEDRLYQRIIHLTEHAYLPGNCNTCKEIAKTLSIYRETEE
jgi:hypothetical protein